MKLRFLPCALMCALLLCGCANKTPTAPTPPAAQAPSAVKVPAPPDVKKPAPPAPKKDAPAVVPPKPAQPSVKAPAAAPQKKPAHAPTKKPAATPPQKPAPPRADSVTFSVLGADGDVLLKPTDLKIEDGDTPFSLLKSITRKSGIAMEFSGSGTSVYVEGIFGLYEFDKGPTSGWLYTVNGVQPTKSAGAYTLKPGDVVEWHYSISLGKDLG